MKTNGKKEKKWGKGGGEIASTRHEKGYDAARRSQAASLSLTAAGLRGRKWACRLENKKTAGFFVRLDEQGPLLSPVSRQLCLHDGVVPLQRSSSHIVLVQPHRIDNAHPTLASERTAILWLLPSARLRL